MSAYTHAVDDYKLVKTESLKRRLDATLFQESFLKMEEEKLRRDQEVLTTNLMRIANKRRAVVKKVGCLETIIKQLNDENVSYVESVFIF